MQSTSASVSDNRSAQAQRPSDISQAEMDIEILNAVPKEFSISDEKSANWLVRKILGARNYAERIRIWAEQEQRRASREEQTLMFLFGRQLESWSKSEIEKRNGRKSVCLPAGTVGFRSIAAKIVIDDERTVLNWARDNCTHAIVTAQKLSKAAIDELFQQTGAIPDEGAHVEPSSERFFIK